MASDGEDRCWNGLVVACRVFGLLTALALWGVGVEYAVYGYMFGIYFLIIAVIISFLEFVFLLNNLVDIFVSRTSHCLRVWDGVLWLDDWKKGGMYFVLFSPPCFVRPKEALLAVITGCLLVTTGILYMLKTFKTKRDEENSSLEDNGTYDRFEEEHEEADDLEEAIVNPTSNSLNGITTLADQSEILDL